MKERTSNTSYTALAAGIMSIITLFGGVTVFLGVVFALFGIIAGSRGKRVQPTAAARWALRISIFGFVLTLAVSGAYVLFYLYGALTPELNFDAGELYEKGKELLIRLIEQL